MAMDLQSRTAEYGPGWHHPETEVGPRGLGSISGLHQNWGDYRTNLPISPLTELIWENIFPISSFTHCIARCISCCSCFKSPILAFAERTFLYAESRSYLYEF